MAVGDTEKIELVEDEQLPAKADAAPEPAEAEASVAEGPGPAKKRRKAAVAFAAGLVALALAGGGIAWAVSARQPEEPAAASAEKRNAAEKSEVELTLKAEESAVMVTVKADGADAGATKAKVVVVEKEGDFVFYSLEREVDCNKAVYVGVFEKGDYELVVNAAPVCEDGSTYELPKEPVRFSVNGKGEPVEVECVLSKIAKEDMSKEQLEAAADILEGAGKAEAASTPSTPSTPSGGGSEAPSASGAPQHQHSYDTPVTAQSWVPNDVWVEDSAAWDEPVYEQSERCICNGCGADITGFTTEHFKEAGRGSSCGGWHSEYTTVQTGTIPHDATGHYEDRGHYETVTIGYQCSCGAVQ